MCEKPIYKDNFYDNLINYRLILEYLNTNENLIKIKKYSNKIEKWSKIIKSKDYFKYEKFKALIDELLKMKNLFEKINIRIYSWYIY